MHSPNGRLLHIGTLRRFFAWPRRRHSNPGTAAVLRGGHGTEFIRRFLLHVLPDGFHRIRRYGLFANGGRTENVARTRRLLNVPAPWSEPGDAGGGDREPQTIGRRDASAPS